MIKPNKFFKKGNTMQINKTAIKDKVRSYFAEPQGKARMACEVFSVLLGLSGILMIIAAVASGSVLGLLGALVAAPLLILLPFYFYHFFKTMLQGVANKQFRRLERNRQVEEYDTLPFRRTFRGMAFYLTSFILVITILMGFLTKSYDILFEAALILPMLYLMRRGYRWIFVFAMIWWTFEKGLQLYVAPSGASVASILVWWAVVIYIYLQAYKVEKARVKLSNIPQKPLLKDLGLALGAFVLLSGLLYVLIY